MLHIQSIVKFRKQGCTRNASDPQVTAQNRLHREFWAGHPNEKWLTDVTEFKWYEGPIIHKLYLSAILDLCDRRIVSYVIRDRNDNKLVFDTLVMEHTSNYWKPIALTLKEAGFYVSVVNAMLIHDFSDNSIRKLKTDRADSLKIANYALTFWNELPPFNDEDETRLVLREQSRMYERLASTATSLRNGLIALADQTFPSIDQAFGHAIKNADSHEKWVDFFSIYWHRDCVLRLSIEKFTESYRKWCLRRNYKFRTNTAHKLYALAQDAVPTLPKNNGTKALVLQACKSLNAVCEAKQSTQEEMNRLASLLPEYEVVMQMEGTGPITGPALMAEIGDVRRFKNKKALVAFSRDFIE